MSFDEFLMTTSEQGTESERNKEPQIPSLNQSVYSDFRNRAQLESSQMQIIVF